jgi:putative nucleotidyltransferase with HDIG domain
MQLAYRLSQFWHYATAGPLAPAADEAVSSALSASELQLFRQMQPADQWHAFYVWRRLVDSGQDDADLQTAALLHDVGKAQAAPNVLERTLAVLLQFLFPARIAAWSQGPARGWRKPLVVKVRHAAWGAELARGAGSSPLTVSLIERHHDIPAGGGAREDRLLGQLQLADSVS